MDLQLENHTAVVTGAASGIGQAIARAFAENHAAVVLVDRKPEIARQALDIEELYGVRSTAFVLDVTSETDMQRAAEITVETIGSCDHLVCAAGIGSGKFGFPFWNLSPADWRQVLNVNLMGVVNAAHAFAPGMVQVRRGTMTFLSSVAGQIGSQTDPPYSAAKAAVINFAQCAAKDLAKHYIRVNTICPGMIKTPLNESVWQAWYDAQHASDRKSYDQWAAEKIELVTPLNRWQEPEDIASMTVFLASPRARTSPAKPSMWTAGKSCIGKTMFSH